MGSDFLVRKFGKIFRSKSGRLVRYMYEEGKERVLLAVEHEKRRMLSEDVMTTAAKLVVE